MGDLQRREFHEALLEARLGRQLTADDFPDDVLMNFDSRDWRSQRLRARLAAARKAAASKPRAGVGNYWVISPGMSYGSFPWEVSSRIWPD
jgi:hypothetical protein